MTAIFAICAVIAAILCGVFVRAHDRERACRIALAREYHRLHRIFDNNLAAAIHWRARAIRAERSLLRRMFSEPEDPADYWKK